MSTSKSDQSDWIKIDLHIHTLDDPKDAVAFSAHQLLERARSFGFRVLAITLHDAVFDRKEVFADAVAMGILLIPAAEVRLLGADVIVLNVTAEEIAQVKNFDDLRRLRAGRGNSIFTIAPHPFYVVGGSIGSRLFAEIDCFDAIEYCHFHIGPFNPNHRTRRGMPSIPMGGCLTCSLFVRPGPKRYNARPTLLRRHASLLRHSSTQSTDHWPCRNRILPSTNGRDSPAQLCGLAAKLD